ncbi:hypothetical protein SSS_10805 [Sarcoptes scabiei]|uniref:Protein farnesyltransferase subunit beta n=1 Tax=Sarcoptes scabiei TaxID=52283 RepID=A0A834R1V8_SARSC|nr:hypothetical protein SSS_10805 [Sarcoptes scabiei]
MDRMEKIRVYAQKSKFNDDAISTRTSLEQIEVEKLIENCYEDYFNTHNEQRGSLQTYGIIDVFLDSSRAWMTYWVSLSLNLLGESEFLRENSDQIIDFLKRCESALGGYGGGPSQDPHLASTYAAINALVTLETKQHFVQ